MRKIDRALDRGMKRQVTWAGRGFLDWLPRRSDFTLTLILQNIVLLRMAATQDIGHQKLSSNSCVNGH
jgi:hypothetical protein